MNTSAETPADRPMSSFQKWFVVALALAILALGVMVEIRSVFLKRRMTDFGDYQRAAWAIRVGQDPYSVTCDNGWHYNYPPLLAILMGPFADPPVGGANVAALPYSVSVVAWYLVGVGAMLVAVHLLATAVETALLQPPRRLGHAWWGLRLGPLLLALPAAGRTLARGQVNTVVLALLAGWLCGMVCGRRITGGLCLAFAICIKVVPAFLLLHPLWRRDRRVLAGCAVGLGVGLWGIPVAVCGPTAAIEQARIFLNVTLAPGLGLGGDGSRAEELTNANTTDSQSIMSVLHNLAHPDSWIRPAEFEPWVKMAHWAAAAVLATLTIGVVGRRKRSPQNDLLFGGALCVVMAVVSPVCHLHYFVFVTPLLAALWWAPRSRWTTGVLANFVVVQALSLFPIRLSGESAMPFREFGVTTAAALAVWGVAIADARRGEAISAADSPLPVSRAA
jgi:hypothetical protein